MENAKPDELTYPLRTASRLTGLSPDLLRAWEKRHQIVVPMRTPGGTRRYTAADVERLRLVKRVVDSGHRVGKVARLEPQELKRLALDGQPTPDRSLQDAFGALEKFDMAEFQRLLSFQLATLGATRFARETAMPLLVEIGDRWAGGDITIAQEHMASGVIRSLIGSALQPTMMSVSGPRIVFAAPPEERHELGLLMAALTALGAGANPYIVGADLPVDDVIDAALQVGAQAVALSIVTLRTRDAQFVVEHIRSRLDDGIQIWIGGTAAADVTVPAGVEYLESLEVLEERIGLLRIGRPTTR